jgi:zinc protease
VDVLSTIMTSEPAGRLYESLVKRRVAASVYGMTFALHDPGILMFMAEATEGTDGTALVQSLIESSEGTAEKPFTPEEVERARSELLKQRELTVADSQRVAIELSDWAAQGDWRLFFLNRDRLEKVTAEDVARVAATYLIRNNRTAGVFEPTKEAQRATIPATPDLAEMIGDYKGRSDVAQGEEFDVDPLAIEKRLARSALPKL